jgi:hypothetical protein
MRAYNQPLLKTFFLKELKDEIARQTNASSLNINPTYSFMGEGEIRLCLDNYSKFRTFEASSVVSSSVMRSSYFLLYSGIDLLEERTRDFAKKLLVNCCDLTAFTDYGIPTLHPQSEFTLDCSEGNVTEIKNITENDIEKIKYFIETNFQCFVDFPNNLTHKSTYFDGYSGCCFEDVTSVDDDSPLIFWTSDYKIRIKIQGMYLTKNALKNIRQKIYEQIKSYFEPAVKRDLAMLKKAMRQYHAKKRILAVKIQEYIKKEKLLSLPKLKMFLAWRCFVREKKEENQKRKNRLQQLQNDKQMLTDAHNITLKNLDKLIQKSHLEYNSKILMDIQDNHKQKMFTQLVQQLLEENLFYNWTVHQKKLLKSLKLLHNIARNRSHKINLKIASIRSGFINNKKFLEREQWFGFNRNKQLGNMLLQCDIDPEILTIDWNDCIIEENSRKVKIALSKLCRLTKTKQYLAFCNTSYCVKKKNTHHTKETALYRMFETILGFNNYTYREFGQLIINHIEFVSKNQKGINWITKYLSDVFDKYNVFLKNLTDSEKCLRWCDITNTKLCLSEVENRDQTFITIQSDNHKHLTKEEIIAKSYNAGVFKYIKEAIKLIKNRSKVMVKKWKDFCDENEIEGEEIQLLTENTIYDKLAVELAIENQSDLYGDY